jgi:hypothetical protein
MTREEKIAEAKRLRESGLAFAKIGKQLCVSKTTIMRWMDLDTARKRARDRHRERRTTDSEFIEKCRRDSCKGYHRRRKRRAIDREHYHKRCATDLEFRFQTSLRKSHNEARNLGYAPCNATVEQLTEAFDGYCHCCGVSETEIGKRLAMDHDHTTGEFRGWLCGNCNTSIGKLRDDPYAAFHYLGPDRAELLFKLLVRRQSPRKASVNLTATPTPS